VNRFKYEVQIYSLMVLIATAALCVSIATSGMFLNESMDTSQKIIQHLKSLRFENVFWILSLPGVIGLILLKRRSEFVSFFIKMFYIVLAVMIVPVGAAFWSIYSESTTLTPLTIFTMAFVTWIMISVIGAFGMAQREYIFGGYKKDTAWRHKQVNRQNENDR